MPVDRLTAEDLLMLWPDEIWPQEIGALAILDASSLLDLGGRVRIEALRDVIAARLHLVPRFRQLLCAPPRGLGGPLWVDAPSFDLSDHLRVVPLPDPSDEASLLLATEQLRRRRLDRSRPLWEISFLPGLPENRVGMFVKMHHAIADGIAGVATLGALLDAAPGGPAEPARPWTPAPPPAARDLFADSLRRHIDSLGRAFSALAEPVTSARHLMAGWTTIRGILAAEPGPRTSLDRVVGPGRNLALIRSDIDLVKKIAHSHDAKVNDVLLEITAGGLRGLLRHRGEPVEDLVLPVYVPVTLRQPEAWAQARGNLVGQIVVPLPIGVPDPGRRLAQIAAETATRKAGSHPSLGAAFRSRTTRRVLLKVLDRYPVNVTTADVPGPQTPLYLAGAQLLEVFPLLPLISNVSLGVGALSYAGQFNIMAIADQDVCPDLDVFAASAKGELQALAAATGARPDRHEQR
jgi:diacylglycerol O-acyltransferase / wax synthase